MCVTIDFSTRVTLPWDRKRETITVPAGLNTERTTHAVRAVLIELDTPQPETGALCYCGELLDIPAVVRRGPARTSEVSNLGA